MTIDPSLAQVTVISQLGVNTAFQISPCLPQPLQSISPKKPAGAAYRIDQLMLNALTASHCIQEKSKFPILTSRAPTTSLAQRYF